MLNRKQDPAVPLTPPNNLADYYNIMSGPPAENHPSLEDEKSESSQRYQATMQIFRDVLSSKNIDETNQKMKNALKEILFHALNDYGIDYENLGMELYISGSLSRAAATPYSDIDCFAVFRDDMDLEEKKRVLEVFKKVEAISTNIFYKLNMFSMDPVGISLARLSGTVEEISQKAQDDPIFAFSIESAQAIFGNETFISSIRENISDLTTPKACFNKAISDFSGPRDYNTINIKSDILRPLDFMLTGLRLSAEYDPTEHNNYKKIVDQLITDGHMNQATGNAIKYIYSRALSMRSLLHAKHQGEHDEVALNDEDYKHALMLVDMIGWIRGCMDTQKDNLENSNFTFSLEVGQYSSYNKELQNSEQQTKWKDLFESNNFYKIDIDTMPVGEAKVNEPNNTIKLFYDLLANPDGTEENARVLDEKLMADNGESGERYRNLKNRIENLETLQDPSDISRTIKMIMKEIVIDILNDHGITPGPDLPMEICFAGSLARSSATPWSDIDCFCIFADGISNESKAKLRQLFAKINGISNHFSLLTGHLSTDAAGISLSGLSGTRSEIMQKIETREAYYTVENAISATGRADMLSDIIDWAREKIGPDGCYNKTIHELSGPKDTRLHIKKNVLRPLDFMLQGMKIEAGIDMHEFGNPYILINQLVILGKMDHATGEIMKHLYRECWELRTQIHRTAGKEQDELNPGDEGYTKLEMLVDLTGWVRGSLNEYEESKSRNTFILKPSVYLSSAPRSVMHPWQERLHTALLSKASEGQPLPSAKDMISTRFVLDMLKKDLAIYSASSNAPDRQRVVSYLNAELDKPDAGSENILQALSAANQMVAQSDASKPLRNAHDSRLLQIINDYTEQLKRCDKASDALYKITNLAKIININKISGISNLEDIHKLTWEDFKNIFEIATSGDENREAAEYALKLIEEISPYLDTKCLYKITYNLMDHVYNSENPRLKAALNFRESPFMESHEIHFQRCIKNLLYNLHHNNEENFPELSLPFFWMVHNSTPNRTNNATAGITNFLFAIQGQYINRNPLDRMNIQNKFKFLSEKLNDLYLTTGELEEIPPSRYDEDYDKNINLDILDLSKIAKLNGIPYPACERFKLEYIKLIKESKNEDHPDFNNIDIEVFRNQYTKKIYHEPAKSLGNNYDEKVEVLDEKAIGSKNKLLAEISTNLSKIQLFLKNITDEPSLHDFCLRNAMSESAYQYAVEIEKQILDIEDALNDKDVSVNELEDISRDINDLKNTLPTKLKNLSSVDHAAGNDKSIESNPEDDVDLHKKPSRINFFRTFYRKINDFSSLVKPSKKETFHALHKLGDEKIDDNVFSELSENDQKNYTKQTVSGHKGYGFGPVRFFAVPDTTYIVKNVLNVPEEDKDSLVSTDGMMLNAPQSINDKLKEFNQPNITGLNIHTSDPTNIALSVVLFERLNEAKKNIDEDKNSNEFQKQRISLVVKNTKNNIKKGITSLSNIGHKSFFRHIFDDKFFIAEDQFATLTKKMRGEEDGNVPLNTFVDDPKPCTKEGSESKEEDSPYQVYGIFKDDKNKDVKSILSKDGEKLVVSCLGNRHFPKDNNVDMERTMECAAREVEMLRTQLTPEQRKDPKYGLILTRGASMPDELICAIQAYCEFNGYPPVRAVLNGSVKEEFKKDLKAGYVKFLEDHDNQLNLEQKLEIMLGQTPVNDRISQKNEAKDIMAAADNTNITSKEMSDTYVIRPSFH